jgi:hypothetical protein
VHRCHDERTAVVAKVDQHLVAIDDVTAEQRTCELVTDRRLYESS